jgi:competence protein ComEC
MKRKIFFVISLIALGLFLYLPSNPAQSEDSGTSQISFIDVGQGDSILMQDPHGFDVLIDGGPTAAGLRVVDYLRSLGVTELEVILNTHADADHVGGLVAVLGASDISVGTIYYNGYDGSTATWNNFVAAANAHSIPMVAAQFPGILTWGDFTVYILNPAPGLNDPEQNDVSVVARIDFNTTRFLFPGDINSTIEATVVARETPVAAQVLKVAHHGSKYSSSAPFLAAVDADNGVISVGQNSYGHPAPETLARLAAQGAQVWRTDEVGTIVVLSDGVQVVFPAIALGYWIHLPVVTRFDPTEP